MAAKRVYRVTFLCQGNVYEIYARKVGQGDLYAFVSVEDIVFGERSQILVDPSEEKLKSEFSGVRRTHIPLHAVVRIDEVEKEGVGRISAVPAGAGNVTPFPVPAGPPGGKPGKG